MKLSIRTQIFLLSVAIILTVGAVVGLFLDSQLQSWVRSQAEITLRKQVFVVKEAAQVAPPGWSQGARADALADRLGLALDTRVTFITGTGRVIGDSALTFDAVQKMPNFLRRPEVAMCRQADLGTADRVSDILDKRMLYVVVRFQSGDESGYVRVGSTFDAMRAATDQLRDFLILAGLLGIGIALLMSGLASSLFTRTFRPLLKKSQALVRRSSFSQKDPLRGDEMEVLTVSLERAADYLQENIYELGEERDRLEAVLEGMDEGVIGVGTDMRVTLVNRGARQLFRLPQHTVGMSIQRLIPNPTFQQFITDSRSRGVVEAEIEVDTGSTTLVLARATPQRSTDDLVIVLYDITRVRHLEKMRRDFVANVSHELRTPVSVVQLNAETLLDGALEDRERARSFVEAIMRNSQRLSRIIDELLDLSRIEAEKYEISKTELYLKEVVDRSVNALATQLEKHRVRVEVAIDPDLTLLANENALEQILTNLIDNATKYSPADGVIRVRSQERLGHVRIEVQDDGPGIPKRHHARLFERFYRVDAGRSREMGGTGLGLAIVKHLAAAMEGRVGVESIPPQGSAFWVELPDIP